MTTTRYQDDEGAFELTVPESWTASRDDEAGVILTPVEGGGMLHLLPFARHAADDVDPAEELYAFLEEQDIELEEDEVEDVELPAGGLMALCEYEEEEEGEHVYWMVGVARGPAQVVFASYSCPVDELMEEELEAVRRALVSLNFVEEGDDRPRAAAP